MNDLFRPESLESQRGQWLGGIRLVRPPAVSLLTAFVLIAAAATLCYLFAGQYTRKARVTGYQVPDGGVIRLLPPQSAILLERRVREGQAVQAG